MPVMPGNRSKMKPNTEYAMYHDGEGGKYVIYYSLDGERTVTGQSAAEAFTRLQKTWQLVESSSDHEGLKYFFKRAK